MDIPDPVTSDVLQDIFVAALMGKTVAGDQIFAPRDWPTDPSLLPCILVQSPREKKEAVGQGVPQFNVFTTIRLVARVTAAALPGDGAAKACLLALGMIQRQIEVAVINSYDLMRAIKRIATVESVNGTKSESEYQLGELVMDFVLEFYQGPEAFFPIVGTPLHLIGIFGDLINVADPTGTYEGSPFPGSVTPAPRTHGPDGRAEVQVLVGLTGTALDFTDPDNSGDEPAL